MLPSSFTFHRHSSTPSPTTLSSSPFPLASPASLGATTPDDDGTNPVDILCFLNIDSEGGVAVVGQPLGGGGECCVVSAGDLVPSSSSSTTSWDSTRSEPDLPIPRPPPPPPSMPSPRGSEGLPVHQRYVRRPTELRPTPGGKPGVRRATAAGPWTSSPGVLVDPPSSGGVSAAAVSSKHAAACVRRIAKRRWRVTPPAGADRDNAAAASEPTSAAVIQRHHPAAAAVSPPSRAATSMPVSARHRWTNNHSPPPPLSQHPSTKLPSLPSPAELAYLRSLTGCVLSVGGGDGGGRCGLDAELAKCGGLTEAISAGERSDRQRVATTSVGRLCPPPSSTSENSRLDSSSTTMTTTISGEVATTSGADVNKKQSLRIYGCSVRECGKLYSKSSHLKAHMRSHTGIIRLHSRLNPRINCSSNWFIGRRPVSDQLAYMWGGKLVI